MNNLIIDIHAHPQLKPLNSGEDARASKGIWESFEESRFCNLLNRQIRKALEQTKKESQANLNQALEGNVKGIFPAMGPVERNFFKPDIRHILLRLTIPEIQYRDLACCITGFEMSKVHKIFNRIENGLGVDYFHEELQPEYEFLKNEAEKSKNQTNKMVIAGDFAEFENHLKEVNTVTCVLTIEGAHSLGNYADDTDFALDISAGNTDRIYNRLMPDFENNIDTMKSWGDGRHCPFFITICHHFSNLLAGHAKSFSPRRNLLNPGMDDLLNQRAGKNEGFSRLGLDVVQRLLSKENGRRVLIDVKHMSAKARIEYFKLLDEQYWSKGEELPVICSHAALSGYNSLEESDMRDSYGRWKRHYLSRQSINMSDEEARIIARSNGLIGIVLHGGRLPGGLAKKQMDSATNRDQLRDISVKLIMSNIFHFVRAVGDKKAWDVLCIGSDMDGVIVPFEIYPDYTRIKDLATHCLQFLTRPLDLNEISLDKSDIKQLMYGYDPQELTEKLMSKNVMNFMKKFFHDDYLSKKKLRIV
jgi:microsomal dipeptidase-like Zn-dependent dipeptidase